MRPEPSYDEYVKRWSDLYQKLNYDQGLAGYFLTKSHTWCENAFGPDQHFSRVIEVGAGTGEHLAHVRHGFDEYIMTDINPPMLDGATGLARHGQSGTVRSEVQNACALSAADGTYDRLIATHVLEHLPEPHRVLREWSRVVKPGGVISIVLPCDPGLAWRLGRAVGSRGKFVRAGIDYDYWMAREHINSITQNFTAPTTGRTGFR